MDQTNKGDVYIKKGFSSWKKAPNCFYGYKNPLCYKTAASYHLVVPQCADVGESMDSQLVQRRQLECKYLPEVTIFSMMADEGTDKSNLEELSFCARTVDDDLNVEEDYLGFYEFDHIKSETVVKAIKDNLMRCYLSLDDCNI